MKKKTKKEIRQTPTVTLVAPFDAGPCRLRKVHYSQADHQQDRPVPHTVQTVLEG